MSFSSESADAYGLLLMCVFKKFSIKKKTNKKNQNLFETSKKTIKFGHLRKKEPSLNLEIHFFKHSKSLDLKIK